MCWLWQTSSWIHLLDADFAWLQRELTVWRSLQHSWLTWQTASLAGTFCRCQKWTGLWCHLQSSCSGCSTTHTIPPWCIVHECWLQPIGHPAFRGMLAYSSCASLHHAEEHLRGIWGRFTLCTLFARSCFKWFHQDLGWLSCLRSPTFRHAVDHDVIRVSPDISARFLWSLLISMSSVLPYFISDARSCHRYLEPNDCSAPKLLFYLVHRRWLDSGMVFSSLTHSIAEANLFLNLFVSHGFFGTGHRKRTFVFSHYFGFVRDTYPSSSQTKKMSLFSSSSRGPVLSLMRGTWRKAAFTTGPGGVDWKIVSHYG